MDPTGLRNHMEAFMTLAVTHAMPLVSIAQRVEITHINKVYSTGQVMTLWQAISQH